MREIELKIWDRIWNKIVGTDKKWKLVLLDTHPLTYKTQLPC